MKNKQAKDFLVQQVVEQASRENVPLSNIEKQMMYFTESDPSTCANPIDTNDQFDAQYNTPEYEAKMSRLLHDAYNRLKAEDSAGKRNWDESIQTLRRGDHYLLVLWDINPRTERPKGDFFKLLGTAVFIVAAISVGAIWSAKNNIDLDRYRGYLLPVVIVIVFLASGGFRLVYRLALASFRRRGAEQDDSE